MFKEVSWGLESIGRTMVAAESLTRHTTAGGQGPTRERTYPMYSKGYCGDFRNDFAGFPSYAAKNKMLRLTDG